MTEPQRVGDLEIADDPAYERRALAVRRVFAGVWALIMLAALLGIFGTGPLSDARSADGPLRAEYERFTRFGTTTELSIAPGRADGRTNVAISRSYLHDMVIDDILPQPDGATVLPDRVVYTFDVQPPGDVKFFSTFREIGLQKATVWGPDGRRVSYTQIVYP
ncbi:MAG TPA: hypothetical protein VG474_04960 [Solirubrobacteraceae bacterium]|nr:hypothetical protein [Solirubrobacteraceae bacterium]